MTSSAETSRATEPALRLVPPAPSRRRKAAVGAFVGAVFLALGGLLYYWLIYCAKYISTDNAYLESELHPISCRIMGYVNEVKVKLNQKVRQGEELAILDDTDVKVELAFKEAREKKAAADLERAKRLFESHAISAADLELAETNLVAARADLNGTHLKLKYTHVLSPIDGTVARRNIEAGQYVQPGQGLFVIVPDQPIWVKANYKETQLAHVRVGDRAELEIDAYSGKKWQGKVESVSPSSGAIMSLLPPENASGNFTKIVQRIPVVISIEPQEGIPLRPGMSVYSTIIRGD